jgi:hypothetical protein
VTEVSLFADEADRQREYDCLAARQGCHPFAMSDDPLRPWVVKLLDADGAPFISDQDYRVFGNYTVPRDDWMSILADAAMIGSPHFSETYASHVFYYSAGLEWRIITVERFPDGSVWIVDDDTLTPAVA